MNRFATISLLMLGLGVAWGQPLVRAQRAATAWESSEGRWSNVDSKGLCAGETACATSVTSIAVDPVDAAHWYAGTRGGGVWATKDAGASWKPLTDDQASLAVKALTIASGDSRVIFAGTRNAGVIKSSDGGATWTLVGAGIFANALTTSSDGRDVVAAASGGIYRSKDGGNTWALRLEGDASAVAGFAKLYAVVGGSLFRSEDGGDSWSPVAGPWGSASALMAIAIAPSDHGTMYVAAKGGSIWKTSNALSAAPAFSRIQFDGAGESRNGLALAVDPFNSATIYFSGDSGWKYDGAAWTELGKHRVLAFSGSALIGGGGSGVWSSADGGVTWKDHNAGLFTEEFHSGASGKTLNIAGSGLPCRAVSAATSDPSDANTMYVAYRGYNADDSCAVGHVFRTSNASSAVPAFTDVSPPVDLPFRAIAIDKNGAIYAGSDQGVWMSKDSGASWRHMGPPAGMPNVPVTALKMDGGVVTALTEGRGAFRLTTSATTTITNVTTEFASSGTVGIGYTVFINVVFSGPIHVTGEPLMAMNTGGVANYFTNQAANIAGFAYVVETGDNSPHLDYTSSSALTLNGGTITDMNGVPVSLTLPAPGAPGSLGANTNIVVNTMLGPAVTNVTSSNPNGTYGPGAVISIQVTFADVVIVTDTPYLSLNTGLGAHYVSGSGTNTLTFTYTVAQGDHTAKLDYSSTVALGGTIVGTNSTVPNLTLPSPGAPGSLSANKNIVIASPVGPTVTNISTTTPNGTYGPGAVISVQASFNGVVNVTGTPYITLNSGGVANFTSGSGTSTLTFTYTVAQGDHSTHLDYISSFSFMFGGGTINGTNGVAANLNLVQPGAAGSLGANSNIVISSPTGPVVVNVSTPTPNGTYGPGAVISVQVSFSGVVNVTGAPFVTLNSGGNANYTSGSGTSTLTFTYNVAFGDHSTHLDYISSLSFILSGATINGTNGGAANLNLVQPGTAGSLGANSNIVIASPTGPTVVNVSTPTPNGTYGPGATISVQVSFSGVVNVTGTPFITLNSGGNANYTSGSGTSTLTFTYTVASGQNSSHLDYISSFSFILSGATINGANAAAANLTLVSPGAPGSLGANSNIIISGSTASSVVNVSTFTPNGTYGAGAAISIQVSFSGVVNVTGTPVLALNSGGNAIYAAGSGTSTLTFTYSVASGQNSSHLDYTSSAALSLSGGSITGAGGVAATLTLVIPGAAGSLGANSNIVISTTTGPTVVNVSSLTANGSYSVGASISIQVSFNGVVNVTGLPFITLNSGGTAIYSSGSGTSTLTFTYTVASGQSSSHLDYSSSLALSLGGGTITGAGGATVTLTFAAPGAAGSLGANSNILISSSQTTAITIQTSPSGLLFSIDGGSALTSPQVLNLSQGSHTITVLSTQSGGTGTQYVFTGWNDGGGNTHSITVTSTAATYVATFKTQYQLILSSSPAAGGTVTTSSGFYDASSVVTVTAVANTGYFFSGWSGNVANAASATTTVTMSAALTLIANFTAGQTPPAVTVFTPTQGASGVSVSITLTWQAVTGATSYDVYFGTGITPGFVTNTTSTSYTPVTLSFNTTYYWAITANNAFGSTQSVVWSFTTIGAGTSGYRFIPVAPCRIIDTRGAVGPFGGPSLTRGGIRKITIPQSTCNIPATAVAYSLNVTVVPPAPLTYLSIWPAGQPQPVVSTLNSFDGRIVANAAIVPAGTQGAINVYASDPTDVIIDINGYFAASTVSGGLAFYALTPCRVVDTRNAVGPLGGPFLHGNTSRSFPISSSSCGVPGSALAYSFNITVVPRRPLGYLSTWPTGQTQPVVSTLNSSDGSIVANAAIVPAGTSGAVSFYVTDDTDVIIDINGYFGPPGSPAAQSLYTVTPCRIADTRGGYTPPFGGPSLGALGTQSYTIPASPCSGIPASAQAYSLNVTALPAGGSLGYLTAWPTGQTQPVVSTLNSPLGKVVANAAIVPAGFGGAVSVFVTDATDLILDINAYFAP
ncbi:MAG TPA: hypothetical protein VKU01_27470 [Bryobacteraceae bacterium]|nr:hypothetical protein [Bryobacteraceae bacterium]